MSENPTPYFSNVADRIRYLRKSSGLTIIELAKKMGVSQAYIVRIERGEIQPTEEQKETIRAFIENKL